MQGKPQRLEHEQQPRRHSGLMAQARGWPLSSPALGVPLAIGLFDQVEWEDRPVSEVYGEHLALIEYADAGFYCYHLSEHHGSPLSLTPSPSLLLAAASQRTRRPVPRADGLGTNLPESFGCGTGALDRWLAKKTDRANPITAVDINSYLLKEATALGKREGLEQVLTFQEGNAESLPFADDSFRAVTPCTVIEEGDADRMLAEMVRVARPGGRVGVIVRAQDLPHGR